MTKFDFYCRVFSEALQQEDGLKIASYLSFIDGHASPISRLLKTTNLQDPNNVVRQRIGTPWCEIILMHLEVLKAMGTIGVMAGLQNTLVIALHTVLAQQSRWCLPILITVNQELHELSGRADRELLESGGKAEFLETAARSTNKAFSLCVTDRYSTIDESRKWGGILKV